MERLVRVVVRRRSPSRPVHIHTDSLSTSHGRLSTWNERGKGRPIHEETHVRQPMLPFHVLEVLFFPPAMEEERSFSSLHPYYHLVGNSPVDAPQLTPPRS